MRSRILVAALAAATLSVGACTDSPAAPVTEEVEPPTGEFWTQRRVAVRSFAATFFTDLVAPPAPGPECGPDQVVNRQAGEGHARRFGDFAITFTFCLDIADLQAVLFDDGTLTGDEVLPYSDGIGTFTFANGDELYVTVEGKIFPSRDPAYDFQFNDPLIVTGGTGRFEDAKGRTRGRSFVDNTTNRTDHRTFGLLRLKRAALRGR